MNSSFCKLLTIFFLISFGRCIGQDIQIEDLTFQNEFEKQAVINYASDTNYLAVLLGSSGRCDQEIYDQYAKRVNAVYESLNPEGLKSKKPKKQIKKVFKTVQSELFEKYQLKNEFVEVFETGNFNCVSSTALYAIILERLGIKYIIQEEPDHVYLIALFDDKQILIEGTDPQSGYVSLTDKLRESQLSALLAMKIISEDDLESPEKLDAVLKELYPTEKINFHQLLGVQYHNKAIYNVDDEDFESAYKNALKAQFFYPHETYKYTIYITVTQLLDETDYLDSSYLPMVAMYTSLDTSQEHYSQVSDNFSYVAYDLLNEKRDVNAMDAFYKGFKESVTEASILKKCNYNYALYKADYYAKLGEVDSSYHYSRMVMSQKPKDLDANSLFMSSLFNSIDLKRFPNGMDTVVFYHDKYESLRENKLFCSGYAAIVLQSAYEKLMLREYKNARKLLDDFELFIANKPDLILDPNQIGLVYSKIAMKEYNFNKSKAQKTVDAGLKLAPSHYDLIRVKGYMK